MRMESSVARHQRWRRLVVFQRRWLSLATKAADTAALMVNGVQSE
jgi:hypothetical protein